MKSNIVKYIFIIVVIILIISAVCIFFHNQKNKENNNVEITNGEQVEYSNELNLAIFNYDSINPLISKNKDVINIGKLIFEPLIDIDEKICVIDSDETLRTKREIYQIQEDLQIFYHTYTTKRLYKGGVLLSLYFV